MPNIPKLAVGEPWDMNDMRTSLQMLDTAYRGKGAAKTIDMNVADDYAQLCVLIMQAETAAKEGRSENLVALSSMAREYASRCLHGTSIPGRIIEDPASATGLWTLQDMHYFQNIFSYVIYRRIIEPLGSWDDIKKDVVRTGYDNNLQSESNIIYTRVDEIIAGIRSAWRYSKTPMTRAQERYIGLDLRRDLHNLYYCSKGLEHCTPQFFEQAAGRIRAVIPESARQKMPVFTFPGAGEENTPGKFCAAVADYAAKAADYDRRVSALEGKAGPADPDFRFDFNKYEKDIIDYIAVAKNSPDTYFERITLHRENIEKLVRYVNGNEEFIGIPGDSKNAPTPETVLGEMTGADYDVELELVKQLSRLNNDAFGDLKNVNAQGRPIPTRQYVVNALQHYASLPKTYLNDYIEGIARNVLDSDYTPQKIKAAPYSVFDESTVVMEDSREESGDEKPVNYTFIPDKSVHRREDPRPFFEDTVVNPLLAYCAEENLFNQRGQDGKQVNVEAQVRSSLNILTRWLGTSKWDFGDYDDEQVTGKRSYKLGNRLTSDPAAAAIRDVNNARVFMKAFSEKAGLRNAFGVSLSNRKAIEADLRSLNDLLAARHYMREFPVLADEISKVNTADKSVKWDKLTRETLETELAKHNALVSQAEGSLEAINALIVKGVSAEALENVIKGSGELLTGIRGTVPNITKSLDAMKEKEAKARADEEKRLAKEAEKRQKEAEKAAAENANKPKIDIVDEVVAEEHAEEVRKAAELSGIENGYQAEQASYDPDRGPSIIDPLADIVLDESKNEIPYIEKTDERENLFDDDEVDENLGYEKALGQQQSAKADAPANNQEQPENSESVIEDGNIINRSHEEPIGAGEYIIDEPRPDDEELHAGRVNRDDIDNARVRNRPGAGERRPGFNPDVPIDRESAIDRHPTVAASGRARDSMIQLVCALQGENHREHIEFDNMKAALLKYAQAVARHGYDGIHTEEVFKEYTAGQEEATASDPAVIKAATEAYKCCVLYLRKHLDAHVTRDGERYRDDRVVKLITGQLTPSGRLRKQAALGAMSLFSRLPEAADAIEVMDSMVTYRNNAQMIHTTDMRDLQASLLRGTGTSGGNKDAYRELNARIAEQKRVRIAAREQDARQNGVNAAPKNDVPKNDAPKKGAAPVK